MRTIRRESRFKRDYKREARGRYGPTLDAILTEILTLLLADMPLPEHLHDHPLSGDWIGYRDCHLHPDLVLIYRKVPDELLLARLGSHSELGF